MDRTVIKVNKLNRLQSIANIAAFLTIEMDNYIKLAIATNEYLNNPNPTLFDELHQALDVCGKQYTNYSNLREQQTELLISNGNLRSLTDTTNSIPTQLDSPVDDHTDMEESVDTHPIMVNLADFRKKKVDNQA